MTNAVADLLPANAGQFETAAAKGLSDVLPVPIRQVVDAATTPVAFLPFLASHESVDLWFEDWSEDRKRAMIAEAVSLAARKGTRIGASRFLSYVDGTIVDVIAYPARFIFGNARIGRTPIGHGSFLARYLVRVVTYKSKNSLVFSRGSLGRQSMKAQSLEKFRRAFEATRTAKAPETQVRIDFGHKRHLLLTDGPPLNGGFHLDQYVTRHKL
jgi:phage tail P2-like protein